MSDAHAERDLAADQRDRDLRVLGSAVALLQSRDLASALPTFAAEVGPELGLDDLTITRIDGEGTRVLDEWRVLARAGASDQHRSGAVAGTELSFPLVRGEHLLGELRARARGHLSPADIATVRRLCDLLAVAIDADRMLSLEQKTVAGLRELDELKTTFLGSVSHELRTTVTIIEGFAMLLSRQWEDLTETQRTEFVDRIWLSARSLGTLVEDLLDLARLDRTTSSVALQLVDLAELVPKVISQLSAMLADHRVAVSGPRSVVATADPVALERVLVNLLSNATKYTPPGTAIEINLTADGHRAVVRVADHGPGISRAEREHVFERFYRGARGCHRAARGLGIGLALVQDLVAQMQGDVSISETPGGGATFEVVLDAPNPTSS